jgi:hypothetical protein
LSCQELLNDKYLFTCQSLTAPGELGPFQKFYTDDHQGIIEVDMKSQIIVCVGRDCGIRTFQKLVKGAFKGRPRLVTGHTCANQPKVSRAEQVKINAHSLKPFELLIDYHRFRKNLQLPPES